MEIIDFFKSENREHWLIKISECCPDWRAVYTLVGLIESGDFHRQLGRGTLLLLTDGDRLVSFVTFAERDSIDDDSLSPWIGFVFTRPEYRGNRYVGRLIARCEEMARENNIPKVYVCTDHVGLYEKYGFSYMESREDIYGGESRIYYKAIMNN